MLHTCLFSSTLNITVNKTPTHHSKNVMALQSFLRGLKVPSVVSTPEDNLAAHLSLLQYYKFHSKQKNPPTKGKRNAGDRRRKTAKNVVRGPPAFGGKSLCLARRTYGDLRRNALTMISLFAAFFGASVLLSKKTKKPSTAKGKRNGTSKFS